MDAARREARVASADAVSRRRVSLLGPAGADTLPAGQRVEDRGTQSDGTGERAGAGTGRSVMRAEETASLPHRSRPEAQANRARRTRRSQVRSARCDTRRRGRERHVAPNQGPRATRRAGRVVLDTLTTVQMRLGGAVRVRAELRRVIRALEDLAVTAIITAERDSDYGAVSRYGVEEFVATTSSSCATFSPRSVAGERSRFSSCAERATAHANTRSRSTSTVWGSSPCQTSP